MEQTPQTTIASPPHSGEALSVRRLFTKPGVHPFDEVEWELRDARIGHGDRIAFEQRDVEFPRSWSQNATNIVAQKYFRGQLDSPTRERSVKQMVGRVAGTIADWGRERGYFASVEDGDAFEAELTYVLLNQLAAFNSPVWFNVGFEEQPQCSACLPFHALVSTPEGMVPIGELVEGEQVGREVYDADGTTRIVAVKHNGRKPVYRVTLANGQWVEATADHVVKAMQERRTAPQWLRVDQLAVGMRMHLHPHRAAVGARTLALAGGFGMVELDEAPDPRADPVAVAEAALAGWLQADGFVGQYETGTNRSLTVEFQVADDDEHLWVLDNLRVALPEVHFHTREVKSKDSALNVCRIRLYGEVLRPFVERWGLLDRGIDIRVPAKLFTASRDEVVAYLRSIFQADGYVSVRRDHGCESARVGFAVIGERWTEDVQLLLNTLGIYSRRARKPEKRADRQDMHEVSISIASERARFAELVGFPGAKKQSKLLESLTLRAGKHCPDLREEAIVAIEPVGVQEVYDIQTESGEFLSNNVAVHNCFILSVEDEMDSILDWNTREGRIFRGGSGSGINLSRIRGSMEPLSKGGTASGPVSFMRGADAWAGTIKSGGKTRRAAKMVVLDVDHPDIRDFIWCKALEEDKAAALRDAGFDMSIDGDGFQSIQYQNANNSVRVTDEFMHAVESDDEWHLIARTTGEPIGEPVSARELMREISEAAWRCADPGVQYDTTINQWHTSPSSGRINASNPCSEYMHVDDSACNLASLNLMKFRRPDGSFDTERFSHAVDIVFLAQEIVVGPSSYPTKEIGDNARAFRQLGLGYANLGAFLMSNGFAYDSDEGRGAAAAITALMTGRGYLQSAKVAAAIGPYERYAENREAHNNVMRMHRDASYAIPDGVCVDRELLAAARETWNEAVAAGELYGYRNAQASVLAPTGTISFLMDCDTTGIEPDFSLVKYKELVGGGTMVIANRTIPMALRTLGYSEADVEQIEAYVAEHGTIVGAPGLAAEHLPVFDVAVGERAISHAGHIKMMGAVQPFLSGAISKCVTGETLVSSAAGLVRIGSLHRGEAADSFRPHALTVASLDGHRPTDAFYYGGERPVREARLASGHRVTGTANHRVLVAAGEGLEWRRMDELEPGDRVAVQYGDDLWASVPARFDDFLASTRYGSQKAVTVPAQMTRDLAFFLGAYAAEGHVARSNWTIRIANADEEVLARLANLAEHIFGVTPRIARSEGKCPSLDLSSKTLVEFFDYLGTGSRASDKRFPDAVLRSPRDMVLAFLEGLSLDSYLASSVCKWAICLASDDMLDDLQAVLTNLGIVHGRISKRNAEYDTYFDEVYVGGRHAQRLVTQLDFPERHKRLRATEILAESPAQSAMDVVPGISGRQLYDLLPVGRSGRSGAGSGYRGRMRHLVDPRTREVSRESLERVATVPGIEVDDWLQVVLDRNLHFSSVAAVEDAGVREVYDISVPGPHAFVGNGIVNHNTVNMPQAATVEDIAEAYVQAWKLGVKALAIYRDGSKTAQALRTDAQDSTDAKSAAAAAAGEEMFTAAEVEARVAAAVEAAVSDAVVSAKAEVGPARRKMPRERESITHKFSLGGHEGYITAGKYEDGTVGEIFLTDIGKEGSTLRGMMNSFATAISIALQYGVPLETLVRKFAYMRFEPEGITTNPEIPFAKSMPDYIMRWLASRFLDADTQEELGILTPAVRAKKSGQDATVGADGGGSPPANGGPANGIAAAQPAPPTGSAPGTTHPAPPADPPPTPQAPTSAMTGTPPVLPARMMGLDLGPACQQCGGMMQRTGSCYTCSSCGNNTGCG
jgi:ribonucleoside-diphosphate reductase alpha chain